MKTNLAFACAALSVALLCQATPSAIAGTVPADPGKNPVLPPAAPAPSLWEVSVRPYGWLAGIDGTMGLDGYTADVDVPFSKILDHLDMVAAAQFEIRHDRWMVLLDGMYLKASADSETPGRLFSSVGVEVEQVMAEATLGYRLIQSERGFLDVFAGVRYIYLKSDLSLNLDNEGVREISEDISREVVDRVSTAVRRAISEAVPEIKSAAAAALTNQIQNRVQESVGTRVGRDPSRLAVLRAIRQPGGRVNEAVKNLIQAQTAEKQAGLSDTAAVASSEVAAAKARVKSKVRSAVARAEKELARRIEKTIQENIPDRVSDSKGWIDPIVGLRGQFKFTDRFYTVAKGDIGGFGVGSDLAWQVYAALGYQMSPRTTLELGYRYLSVDYQDGGFSYDVNTAGAVLAMGIKF